ncbi:ent-kaurene oxidase [Xylaria castorea]|nr:ent-kaurene oxidase [Xylaria castorea]
MNAMGSGVMLATATTAGLLLLILFISNLLNRAPKLWRAQPVVGTNSEAFTWLRSTLRSIWQTRNWVFEGYAKYSKNNSFFVLPSVDRGPIMVVPPQQIRKVYGLPTTVLDVYTTSNNTIQTKWTIWDNEVSENNFQMNLIRDQLTRNLDILTPRIATELEEGLNREWGVSTTEWTYVNIWISAIRIIGGAANSAFCGAPMCRDMDFLQRIQVHSMGVFLGSVLINSTPAPLRFIPGYLVGWFCYYHLQRVSKLCLPFVKERLENTKLLRDDSTHPWCPPKDGLQWIIEECFATGDPAQLKPERVLHRLVFINDISLHSTSYTTQNVILDIACADPSCISALREESGRVLREAGGRWTRQAVSKLVLIDSTIRESMRLAPFNSVGLPRTVIDPHGIWLEREGSKFNVPYGTAVTIPVEPIHYDESIYPDARSFKPFRFARTDAARDILDAFDNKSQTGEARSSSQLKTKSSATVDDAFLGFGFGKHACPGRFFALNEIKIFIAIMVLHYDLEPLKRKPQMTPIIWLNMPLFTNLKLGIRRREPKELH